ncbi:unnamed protein product [Auanema sp. JU1783]|nr:unnamed protein product [Auanema sp. JU1783]
MKDRYADDDNKWDYRTVRPPSIDKLPKISAVENFRAAGLQKILLETPEILMEQILSRNSLSHIKGTIVYDRLNEQIQRVHENVQNMKGGWRWGMLNLLPHNEKNAEDFAKKCLVTSEIILALLEYVFDTLIPNNLLGRKNEEVLRGFIVKCVISIKAPKFYPKLSFKESDVLRSTRSKNFIEALPDAYYLSHLRDNLLYEISHFCTWFSMSCILQFLEVIRPSSKSLAFKFYPKRGYGFWKKVEIEKFSIDYGLKKVRRTFEKIDKHLISEVKILKRGASLRPICPFNKRADWNFTNGLRTINCALDYYMETAGIARQPGLNLIKRRMRKFLAKHRRLNNNEKLFFIKADVTKCFASLDHCLLKTMLTRIIGSRPCFSLHQIAMGRKGRFFRIYGCGSTKAEAESSLIRNIVLKQKTIKELKIKGEVESVQRVVESIMRIIGDLRFRVGNKRRKLYEMTKGVPQGFALSSRLAHIYLSWFDISTFCGLGQGSTMFRYADDYLFILSSEEEAIDILDKIQKPKNEYSLVFRKDKTQTSFTCPGTEKKQNFISWCGINIDTVKSMIASRPTKPSKFLTYKGEAVKRLSIQNRIRLRKSLRNWDKKAHKRHYEHSERNVI